MGLETEKKPTENISINAPVINEVEAVAADTDSALYDYVWKSEKDENEKKDKSLRLSKPIQANGSLAKHIRSPIWMAYDVLWGAMAILMGFALSPSFSFFPSNTDLSVPYLLLSCLIFGLSIVVAGFVLGLYEKLAFTNRVKIVTLTGPASVLAVSLTALFFALVLFEPQGRWVLLITLFFAFIGLSVPRIMAHNSSLKDKLKVAIVGDMKGAVNIYNTLKSCSERGLYEVVGICVTDAFDKEEDHSMNSVFEHTEFLLQCPDHLQEDSPAIVGLSDYRKITDNHALDKIIVSKGQRNNLDYFSSIMECTAQGARVMSWSSFNEDILKRVAVEDLSPNWFYSANLNVNNAVLLTLKRVIDISVVAVPLLVALPVMAIVALMIKLTSKGPVLYKQVRTGRFGRPFVMYKFRTMDEGSDKNGPTWTTENDERVTLVGKVLRKTRLDELPQLYNILRGDMSFVGPRPERPDVIEDLINKVPYYDMRHIVPPGLTGFAQVTYKYGASVEDARIKLQYDLYYIKNFSILLDLQIILRTFSAMMKGAQ